MNSILMDWLCLCPSGQSFWPQTQRPQVRFPALPDFLGSCGSETGSIQHREDKLRSYLNEKVAALVYKTKITEVGKRQAGHGTPFCPQKLALKFAEEQVVAQSVQFTCGQSFFFCLAYQSISVSSFLAAVSTLHYVYILSKYMALRLNIHLH
jgi:hypothetical protein